MKVIGIDPDVDKCGVAITDGYEILELRNIAVEDLPALFDEFDDAMYAIENVMESKAMYNRGVGGAVQTKIAQNVGECKAVFKVILRMIAAKELNHVIIDKRAVQEFKGKPGKIGKRAFKDLTGYRGESNQDTRDAGIIALSVFKGIFKRGLKAEI